VCCTLDDARGAEAATWSQRESEQASGGAGSAPREAAHPGEVDGGGAEGQPELP